MKTIVLIACCGAKMPNISRACDLYISDLFKKSMSYAKSIVPNKIYILSAKHGLLKLERKIEPYDETLKNKNANEKKKWAENVLFELGKETNLELDKYIFLAGSDYRKYLLPKIKTFEIPLKGLGIGKQLQWLKENTNDQKM